MKLNTQTKRNAGMTLLELTVVILVLLSLISILFVGARAWKRGSDRSANIMNIRNCQQAMRGEQNMKQLNPAIGLTPADTFVQADLEEFMQYPTPVNADVSYTDKGVITPESANPAVDWNHIWLDPSTEGLPGGLYGHNSFEDVTGW